MLLIRLYYDFHLILLCVSYYVIVFFCVTVFFQCFYLHSLQNIGWPCNLRRLFITAVKHATVLWLGLVQAGDIREFAKFNPMIKLFAAECAKHAVEITNAVLRKQP